ncbi:hypothetical protein [Notoacmeibacter sp. MSK16QG-6]|uniref:hypothetical protein n=1 Tax=Notoacmeibacter sp. MSK16QG-6 TaxID=2957982 RepID=UPI0020A0E0A8|nr:hypothetical protein [Notoacmeibacter sp. MSK16QG-6]MCP1198024.1 hypothetical protein [Notoacmeibacter sp. MSK16QG-6]
MMRHTSVFFLRGVLFAGAVLFVSSTAFALSELTTDDGQNPAGPIALPGNGTPAEVDPSPRSQDLPPLNDAPVAAPVGEPGPVETAPLPPPSAPGSGNTPQPTSPPAPSSLPVETAPADSQLPAEASDTPLIEAPVTGETEAQAAEEQSQNDTVAEPAPESAPPPPVSHDLSTLPEPVARMRQLIIDAARSGDVERLRPLLGMGERQTTLSLGGVDGDVIAFLKEVSGDEEGQEILAILSEILEAGYVHFDEGEKTELYVWPYFFGRSLETLTPEQKVELFRIVTAGDYADMLQIGAYVFYRVGITPDGEWAFFVAGD